MTLVREVVICSEEGCTYQVRRRGMCVRHYNLAKRENRLPAPLRGIAKGLICSEDGCDRPMRSMGRCGYHYSKLRPKEPCKIDGCSGRQAANGYCVKHYQRERAGRPIDRYWEGNGNRGPLHQLPTPGTSGASHHRVRTQWGSASLYLCMQCPEQAMEWAYDGTDPTELYSPVSGYSKSWQWHSLWPEFYKPMCKKCHARLDKGATALELHEYRLWRSTTGKTLADL